MEFAFLIIPIVIVVLVILAILMPVFVYQISSNTAESTKEIKKINQSLQCLISIQSNALKNMNGQQTTAKMPIKQTPITSPAHAKRD